jgi:tRNA-splicing ligase RtcB (3'-phosphate/5'-hydroxy nucleic acid ligase)
MLNDVKTRPEIIETGEAEGILPVPGGKPVTVIGTKAIRDGFDAAALQQAINSRMAPGVTDLVLNPDAHAGYGAPVGCVMVSPTHVYPGPVGVDIKCSMSLLQMDIPEDQLRDKTARRAVINAILERIPTGPGRGQRHCKKSRKVGENLGFGIAMEGATPAILNALGIPVSWAERCEDAAHGDAGRLESRLHAHLGVTNELDTFSGKQFEDKIEQLGSYGGGNHFGECNIVRVADNERALRAAEVFGLKDGCAAFLSHCGSRGFGYKLAQHQFRTLQGKFERWSIPLPGEDKELVYAPLGTPEADAYIDDMSLGANFATVNHLLINALVLESFQEVFPGAKGWLVYFISHNIAREEVVNGRKAWVHRKGATRAFPAGHHALKGTIYESTGHPILLPGNPKAGSCVMVANAGAVKSCYSVNHGAGRAMGRKAAMRALDQKTVDADLDACDILSNCRQYPIDEAPAAYKDFDEVLASVAKADLASEVARLHARFVLKDSDQSNGGAA